MITAAVALIAGLYVTRAIADGVIEYRWWAERFER